MALSETARLGCKQRSKVLALSAIPFGVAALVILPFGTDPSTAATILSMAIAAMSLDLLLGYAGLASFGHAAFFGLGAYTAALVSLHWTSIFPVSLIAAVIVGALSALIIGWLAIRSAGIYFIFLTLALAQMVYAIAFKWRWLTGGDDGLTGVKRPDLGPLQTVINLSDPWYFYIFCALIFMLCWFVLGRIVASGFGTVLIGIRENPHRMSALGYDIKAYKTVAFVIAGAFAGAAGALYVYLYQVVAPDQLGWLTSAYLMVMVVLGGPGTLIGSVVGATMVELMQLEVSNYTDRWPTIMAVLFIAVVMAGRGGLWGMAMRVLGR